MRITWEKWISYELPLLTLIILFEFNFFQTFQVFRHIFAYIICAIFCSLQYLHKYIYGIYYLPWPHCWCAPPEWVHWLHNSSGVGHWGHTIHQEWVTPNTCREKPWQQCYRSTRPPHVCATWPRTWYLVTTSLYSQNIDTLIWLRHRCIPRI